MTFNMANENSEKVSVTWKWLAVTLVSVLLAMAAFDRNQVGAQVQRHDDQLRELSKAMLSLPTREDFLRLSDKMDKIIDQARPSKSTP